MFGFIGFDDLFVCLFVLVCFLDFMVLVEF